MLAAPQHWLRSNAAAWAQRRQGPDPLTVTLEKRRIYILPTRFGFAFGLTVIAMLLGALNYGSSLGFALTFLLAGLGIVIMRHCHNNLRGIKVRFVGAQPVFAGEAAEFRFALLNDARYDRFEITLARADTETDAQDVPAGQTRTFSLSHPSHERGVLQLDRFMIATRYPGNLFRAWTWMHMPASCIVYPRPAPRGRPLPNDGGGEGQLGSLEHGDADFIGLRAAVPGDPPQRIAWKAFARNDELMVKQFSAGAHQARVLAWNNLPNLSTEQRLAQLTRWCLDAAELNLSVGLAMPDRVLPVGLGHKHLHDCLRTLALFQDPDE